MLFNDALDFLYYTVSVMDRGMSMEHWCNDTDKGKQKLNDKKTCLCYFVYHKSHTGWPGIEVWPLQWQSNDHPFNNSFIINLKRPAVLQRPRMWWGFISFPWNNPIWDKM